MKKSKLVTSAVATALAFSQFSANAEETADAQAPKKESAAEIAAELANPNTVLGTLNFNLDYVQYDGDLPDASDQSALRLTFQPSLPYPISKGINAFARPAVPVIIKQDLPSADGYDQHEFELGDIGFDVGVGKSWSNGVVAIGGIVGTLPTATDDALGKDQWALGPEALVAVVKDWGALGLLVTHQWDVAGNDDIKTNLTAGQYFYTFNLTEGWQIKSGPTFSYDHEAESGQRWTVPLGIGVNKTVILGGTPWKFGVELWNYVKAPDAYAPDWQLRFIIAPVIPLPW